MDGLFTILVIHTYALCSAFNKIAYNVVEYFGKKNIYKTQIATMNAFRTMYCDERKK